MPTACVRYRLRTINGSGFPPYWEDKAVLFEGGVHVEGEDYFGKLTADDPVKKIAEKADWAMQAVDTIPQASAAQPAEPSSTAETIAAILVRLDNLEKRLA